MDVTDLDLQTRLLAGLPIVNAFYDRLGIDAVSVHDGVLVAIPFSPGVCLLSLD